ncbi:hypothetical protein Bca52824_018490 [Brassica carinata]|uniref:Uncharacterized protein n=1 Tax=Brassica carinata TaxID=52824 RepID=A0A8X8AYM8_BRACI|nr:hypothetical protein Bca52824_018490 [Brassica carinata]
MNCSLGSQFGALFHLRIAVLELAKLVHSLLSRRLVTIRLYELGSCLRQATTVFSLEFETSRSEMLA